MKKLLQLSLIATSLLLTGCLTTRSLSIEEQTRYERVAVISTLGDRFTATHEQFLLLAIRNKLWIHTLGENSHNTEFEDFVVEKLQGKVPFQLVPLPELRDKNFRTFFSVYGDLSKVLKRKGFDGAFFIHGNNTVQGDYTAGIVYIYDELGIYKRGNDISTFCNFSLSFYDAKKDRNVFADNGFKREKIAIALDIWPSEIEPLMSEQLEATKLQAVNLAKQSIEDILTDRFLNYKE